MNEQINLSKENIEDAVRSGQRSIEQHEAFSTETVQLAFGRNRSGRIVHVSSVDRGLDADCFCPACSERLIARQGQKKAWHFAHSDGHACRDALSATLARWLAQCIEDGMPVTLPEVSVRWGKSSRPIQDKVSKKFHKAAVEKIGQGGPYQITATTEDARDTLRIMFRTARTSFTPDVAQMREDGISTFYIDIYSALSERMEINPESGISETWLTKSLTIQSPREWIWNELEQDARNDLTRERLGKHLDAISCHVQCDDPAQSVSEAVLEAHGLLPLCETPRITGERFLGPDARTWRSIIVSELLLKPFSGAEPYVMIRDAAFGRRNIIAIVARNGLVSIPGAMLPLNADDQAELLLVVPDLRRPIEIIEDFLADLCLRGMLKASTRKARQYTAIQPAHIKSELRHIKDADWVASDKISVHATRVAKAELMLAKDR